ncbi:hypothetical protein L873DRAFT_1150951 [Choiromyces venosus 120613-1]|uniref:Uncharacterized protein n=1 Tax=Choiromyces venosus 120613-1 TaxID=1336337 RepID=A0A3N4JIQ4_9PEZI|nr:hypothetical protein L873DRAFT_1150951 [Choiromyces venosus 120613-1]
MVEGKKSKQGGAEQRRAHKLGSGGRGHSKLFVIVHLMGRYSLYVPKFQENNGNNFSSLHTKSAAHCHHWHIVVIEYSLDYTSIRSDVQPAFFFTSFDLKNTDTTMSSFTQQHMHVRRAL